MQRRGRVVGEPHQDSGFSVVASDAPGSDLTAQLQEAEEFVRSHQSFFELLKGTGDVEDARLDFGYFLRLGTGPNGTTYVSQSEYLPPSLFQAAGSLCIAIELTI